MPNVKRDLLESALELTEVHLERLVDSDLLRDIPVVGVAAKIVSASKGVRDRLYAAKLHRFVSVLDKIPGPEKIRFREKITTNPAEFTKAGERLLLVLERLTDIDRPAIMATVFLAFLDGLISRDDLHRMWDAIADAYIGDLNDLLGGSSSPQPEHLRFLHRTGLSELAAGETWDSVGTLTFHISDLGQRFLQAYHQTRNRYPSLNPET